MKDLLRYFAYIDNLIRHSGVIDDSVSYRHLTPTSALIDGTLTFADGSRLEFTETIRQVHQRVVKQRYRYQYLIANQPYFRYDNSPHYPDLSTFPHHKHTPSGEVIESDEVMLQDVVHEILQRLANQ